MAAPAPYMYVCSQCCRRLPHRTLGQAAAGQQRHASSQSPAVNGLVAELRQSTTRYSRQTPRPSKPPPSYHNGNLTDYVASAAVQRSTGRYSRGGQTQHQPQGEARRPGNAEARGERSRRAYTSELEDLMVTADASEVWSFFQTEFRSPDSPALSHPALRDVAKHNTGVVYDRLRALLTDRWLLQSGAPPLALPSPLQVLDRFDQLGLSRPLMYHKTLWSLVHGLEVAVSREVELSTHPALAQLLDLWGSRLLPKPGTDASKTYEGFITSLVFGRRDNNLANPAVSAFLTHDLLRHIPTLPASLEQHTPFVVSLNRVLSLASLNQSELQDIKSSLVRANIPATVLEALLERLAARRPASGLQGSIADSPSAEPRSMQETVKHYVRIVNAATERQNLDAVESLWRSVQNVLQDEHAQPDENSPLLLRLYDCFLGAFFELRRPQQALGVWNHMVRSGLRPGLRTWNVMMKSCHISRDIDIMESMWQRMRSSGLQPDAVSWSTRIYGLLRVGSVRDGILALDEMGREWLAAQKPRRSSSKQQPPPAVDLPEVPKPNTAILNSAISALRGKRSRYIPSVLAWSRSFDIEPDVITYNALMHVALSEGETAEAMKILQRMAAANVKPDSATITVLITSVIHSSLLTGLTHAEQEEKVMGLITSSESYGSEVDVQGYALLIDRLLKEHGNLQAAHRVLDHMDARKVKCTPHIYTILMTHYFDCDPPKLYEATSLWTRLQNEGKSHGPVLDVIFYDRMMEGFARHGDMASTMTFLTRMSKEGKRPGWLALLAVVRCLTEKNDWERLAQVVRDCHRQEGYLSAGMRGRKGQTEFWGYIADVANDLYDTPFGKEMLEIVELQRQALNGVA